MSEPHRDPITTFNGTFSVSMREGIVNDILGYIQFTSNLVSIWLYPTMLENHFGPTPNQGIVLPQTEGDEATGSHKPKCLEKSTSVRTRIRGS